MSLLFVVLTPDVKKLKIQVGGYTTDTISPPRYKFGSPGADHRMYYLDQPRCRPISKNYLINRFRNNVYRREALPTFDLRKPTFSAPLARSLWWDPPPPRGGITTKMQDAVSGTNLRLCAKFQPTAFSSFGEDRALSLTDRQTNSKLNIPQLPWGEFKIPIQQSQRIFSSNVWFGWPLADRDKPGEWTFELFCMKYCR